MKYINILIVILIPFALTAQNGYLGVTNSQIFAVDSTGSNPQSVYKFSYLMGFDPKGKLTEFGSKLYGNLYGGIFSYDYNADTYSYLADFDNSVTGTFPFANLVISHGGFLFGTTIYGGANGCGCIFKFDTATNQIQKVFDFNGTTSGCNPKSELLVASNNKIYGTTNLGGASNRGVLFEFEESTGVYTKLLDFHASIQPIGGLIEGPNNFLYGMTESGGLHGGGVLFKYDIANDTILNLYLFPFDSAPKGKVLLYNNKLYGMTSGEGTNGDGVLFEFDLATSTFNVKHNFTSSTGAEPNGSLELAPNGKFYGTTRIGGSGFNGVLFEYDLASNTYTVIRNLLTNEGYPTTTPMIASNGKLYLICDEMNGALLEYDFINPVKGLFRFSQKRYGDPCSKLMKHSSGKIYGVTEAGGYFLEGVLYEFDNINNKIIVKHEFNVKKPSGALVEGNDGKLYGVINEFGYGSIYSFDPATDSFEVRVTHFTNPIVGHTLTGEMLLLPNGKFLTTSEIGGANNAGQIVEYDPSNDTIIAIKDIYGHNATAPIAPLIRSSNGLIYAPFYNHNKIFEYNYFTNNFTNFITYPAPHVENLVEGTNGNLYGISYSAGTNNIGAIWKYDTVSNVLTLIASLDSVTGIHPRANLISGPPGKLMGVAYDGGVNNRGTVFEYDYFNNIVTPKSDLSDSVGGAPIFPLLNLGNQFSTNLNFNKSENAIRVYPNPVSHYITIESEENIKYIKIFDCTGRLVWNTEGSEKRMTISAAGFKSGYYIVRIISGEKVINKSIIIK